MMRSGFNTAGLQEISGRLRKLQVACIPVAETPPGITWVKPELRCEVTFQEETPQGHFWAPAFKRLIE